MLYGNCTSVIYNVINQSLNPLGSATATYHLLAFAKLFDLFPSHCHHSIAKQSSSHCCRLTVVDQVVVAVVQVGVEGETRER